QRSKRVLRAAIWVGESEWFFIEKSLTFISIYTYNGMPNSTPFFAAFGSLLFGRAPRCRLQELLGQWPQMPSINQYMEAFGEFIPQTLLGRSKEKVNSRQRIFSPLVTFWAFLAQVLERGSSCRDALQRISAWWQVHFPGQGSPSADTSAYCQARARLDETVLQQISSDVVFPCSKSSAFSACIAEHFCRWSTMTSIITRSCSHAGFGNGYKPARSCWPIAHFVPFWISPSCWGGASTASCGCIRAVASRTFAAVAGSAKMIGWCCGANHPSVCPTGAKKTMTSCRQPSPCDWNDLQSPSRGFAPNKSFSRPRCSIRSFIRPISWKNSISGAGTSNCTSDRSKLYLAWMYCAASHPVWSSKNWPCIGSLTISSAP